MIFTKMKRNNSTTEAKLPTCFLVEHSRKVGISGSLLLTALLCAEGVFIERPKNVTVVANHSTFLNCSMHGNKSNEPTWYHHTLVRTRQDVYDNQKIKDKYKDRFTIDKNLNSGTFNLLVLRPKPKDAGRYECVEDPLVEDTGPSAELTVLDSNLHCEFNKDLNEIVGHTECANPIAPDQLQLICSVTYSGNIPPQMEWEKVGSTLKSSETTCGVRGNRVLCNSTFEPNRNIYGSVYICQIKTAEQHSCSLTVNKIIHTLSYTSVRDIATTEEAFCSANTSVDLPCSYKWIKENETVQFGQTLRPSIPGKYRCEAKCKIRNEICAFTAMVINVSSSGNRKMLWLLVLIIAVGVIVAASAYYLRKKCCRSQPQQSVPPSLSPENGHQPERRPLMPVIDESIKMGKMDSDDAIQKPFNNATFIGKGLNGGEIRGPVQWKGKQRTCERLTFTVDEVELAKEQDIAIKSKKWMVLQQTNLIMFYDVIVKSPSIYIFMDYAAGGSVRDALRKCTKCQVNLEISVINDWATQIAKGMEYLHEKEVVHKNLNSLQILIMESFEASYIMKKTLKISQFCLVDDSCTRTHAQVNYAFTAPEAFDNIYDTHSDAWSFGIVIWEMLTGRIPYEDVQALKEVTQDIRNGATVLTIPDSCPKALEEILKGCRNIQPYDRPAFTEIVKSLQAWQLVSSPVDIETV